MTFQIKPHANNITRNHIFFSLFVSIIKSIPYVFIFLIKKSISYPNLILIAGYLIYSQKERKKKEQNLKINIWNIYIHFNPIEFLETSWHLNLIILSPVWSGSCLKMNRFPKKTYFMLRMDIKPMNHTLWWTSLKNKKKIPAFPSNGKLCSKL